MFDIIDEIIEVDTLIRTIDICNICNSDEYTILLHQEQEMIKELYDVIDSYNEQMGRKNKYKFNELKILREQGGIRIHSKINQIIEIQQKIIELIE